MSGEKTEKATPKKRNDERKKGNVVQSKDVVTTASVVVMFFLLKTLSPYIFDLSKKNMARIFVVAKEYGTMDMPTLTKIMIEMTMVIAVILTPILLTAMAVGVIGTGIQTKFLVSSEKLKPKFSNLNPISGLKKMVSIRSLVELLKSSAKLIIIGVIIFNTIIDNFKKTPKLLDATFEQSAAFVAGLVYEVAMNISVIFFFVALFDYVYQWWENEKNLKMSKQDIKEEYKSMEGDPQVKSKIKQRQRDMAMSRMIQQVPTADVVIRNPTHFAVAIKYDIEKSSAPIIVAKGQEQVALRIIEIATEHGIHVLENRPLARALFETVEVSDEIPAELYGPVAEILAFVYNLKEKK